MSDLARRSALENTPSVLETLRGSQLFAGLGDQAQRRIASHAESCTYARGQKIWEHGEPCSGIAIVASGRVKCWSPGTKSRQWVSSVVRVGGTCGLGSAVDGGPYSCAAEPLEKSRVLRIPLAPFREVLDHDAEFARHVARLLAGELRRSLSACEDLTLKTPLQRLAGYLAKLAGDRDVVDLKETHTQLAGQLGTVREVVGRGFRQLESRGIIARAGRTVRVLRPTDLLRVAGEPTRSGTPSYV